MEKKKIKEEAKGLLQKTENITVTENIDSNAKLMKR